MPNPDPKPVWIKYVVVLRELRKMPLAACILIGIYSQFQGEPFRLKSTLIEILFTQ